MATQCKRQREETAVERAARETAAAQAAAERTAKVAAAQAGAAQAAAARTAKAAAERTAKAAADQAAADQRAAAAELRAQYLSNRQHDSLMHAVNRSEAGGSTGRLGSAIARAQNQPHFDVDLLRRAGSLFEQRQKEQEKAYNAWRAGSEAARQERVEVLSERLSSSELTAQAQLGVLQAASSSARHTNASGRSRGADPVCNIFGHTIPYQIKSSS